MPPDNIPDDFLEMSEIKSPKDLAEHYSKSERTITRWRRAAGIGQEAVRNAAIPDDFLEMSKIKSAKELEKHYGNSWRTITRWRKALGLTREVVYHAELPADIDVMAKNLAPKDLARHYGWTIDSLRRMLKSHRPDLYALSVEVSHFNRKVRNQAASGLARAAAKRSRIQKRREQNLGLVAEKPPQAKVETAMNYLRRWGSCYPLRVRYPERDGYWFYGREWSDAELIAEAKRRGWVPLDEMTFT